ncbi:MULTISPECIES: hypothetical protein [Bacillus]|uniref:hypothetical protein n=1 Tax=Bacillus TaxID=1386 RepID=UPI0014826A4C|nr:MULTISPECIES: hypothetical protein [Bacillus]MDH4424711.1 hypothetical protein [Bacillus cereus]
MEFILYFGFYFGLPFLIIGTALFLFLMVALPKNRNKNLSFVMIGLGVNLFTVAQN